MCSISLDLRDPHIAGHSSRTAAACAGKPCFGPGCAAFAAQALAQATATQVPIDISKALVDDILRPYRPHARYLKSAQITQFRDKASKDVDADKGLIKARGKFSIAESCYIDDTGHFNAVEFNICYNQLAYVMFGKCVEAGLMHRLRCEKVDVPTLAEFKRHQLPNMVIVNIESRYYRQLDSRAFEGVLTLDRISSVGGAWFFFTTMTFSDGEGVKARGAVVLAFNPDFSPLKH